MPIGLYNLDKQTDLPTFPNVPWRAESPPTGRKCWSRLMRANDLLLYTDQAESSRNSSCATQNCLQQSHGFEIVLLGSWGLNFPEVTYTAASVGVSWLSVCSDKAPGVLEGGASLTHQSAVRHNYISALCLPKHGHHNALIQGLFCSGWYQKFPTLD